ncbi:hypothetical protein [Yersinia mollaretii]|uniref:hypothetical protein n=2 Tax=Yersinia mollaretii TaxID=33060 RepID=UPI000C1DD8EA|nr:hypothetical protein [Yersinia mollaretii]MDN0109853.1 hypothetical protein [Yersinia mollaretii]PJE89217.1 hypothetical protein CU280_02940 [Yersinia mollaretii]
MNILNTSVNSVNFQIDSHQQPPCTPERKVGYFAKNINRIKNNHICDRRVAGKINKKLESKNYFTSVQMEKLSEDSSCGIIYSPFYNEDMVIQAIGINAGKILKGKDPLSVICSPDNIGTLKSSIENVKENELTGRLNLAEKYSEVITSRIDSINSELGGNSFTLKDMFKQRPSEVKRIGEYRAINQMKLIRSNALKYNSINVVYVIGHGAAGSPNFFETTSQRSRCKPVTEVISEINKLLAGKVKDSVKIKITSCESADRETIDSIDKIPENISEKKRGVAPLALSVKEEVSKYLSGARVFGYHGLGISRGTQYIGGARCAMSDFDDETGEISNFIKASLVKKEF